MSSLIKAAIIFLLLIVIHSVLVGYFQLPMGKTDYFTVHGYGLLFAITLFPRLTLLFSSIPFGGIFWWLGFFICPRILVASLATLAYFNTNPLLVVISWMVALSGETWEKNRLQKSRFVFYSSLGRNRTVPKENSSNDPNTIEAEYKVVNKD